MRRSRRLAALAAGLAASGFAAAVGPVPAQPPPSGGETVTTPSSTVPEDSPEELERPPETIPTTPTETTPAPVAGPERRPAARAPQRGRRPKRDQSVEAPAAKRPAADTEPGRKRKHKRRRAKREKAAAEECLTAPVANFKPLDPDATPEERRKLVEELREREREVAERLAACEDRADEMRRRRKRAARRKAMRNADGSPTTSNPGFFDALPGPSTATGVPNFVIRKFRVPIFLLPIYQAAGIEYGIRWEILAAINEIETDYGRNLNVSSAGALGWMQFIPSSWRAYGVDANKDGVKDPYNPVDAIFAAANYLDAAGYEEDVRRAIFAYNHADWYVDSVMLRARLIAGLPADVTSSLTGLTEGRFPVAARARYADDLAEQEALRRVKRGENAANVIESDDDRRDIAIYAPGGAPVVAVNDGVVKEIGRSRKLGRYIELQDVYGNRFTYAHLGDVADHYPVPKEEIVDAQRVDAEPEAAPSDAPKPKRPASAGRQPDKTERDSGPSRASLPIKERLFAHPGMPGAQEAGGLDQLAANGKRSPFESYNGRFARPFGLDAKDVRLRRLKEGARVVDGTVLGRIGRTVPRRAPHLSFSIRPAGRGSPRIDPKPILDGWKLLESTAIYRAAGRNVLRGDGSIGQILLLSKPLLERRVLGDERIEIYDCGRTDIQSGQVDRRVLATLAYLAESGFRPTVTSLKCGHSFYTASGNVSHHSSGNAVDIAKVNGVPILGHQEAGGITEQTVRQLMRLQGTMEPDQVISLLELGGATFAMADHADHIHVGFQPLFGSNARLGRQAFAILKPGQWSDLLDRLREIQNPIVPQGPSKYSLPARKQRASEAHGGE